MLSAKWREPSLTIHDVRTTGATSTSPSLPPVPQRADGQHRLDGHPGVGDRARLDPDRARPGPRDDLQGPPGAPQADLRGDAVAERRRGACVSACASLARPLTARARAGLDQPHRGLVAREPRRPVVHRARGRRARRVGRRAAAHPRGRGECLLPVPVRMLSIPAVDPVDSVPREGVRVPRAAPAPGPEHGTSADPRLCSIR